MADKDPELKCAAREYIEQIKNGTATDGKEIMPRCEAEKATERIEKNKTLTPSNILEMELYARRCTKVCSVFIKALNRHIIKSKRDKDTLEKPTSQEEDKKAQGRRWWRKRF